MEAIEIEKLVEKQRNYFLTGATLPVDFRIEQLKKLKTAIKKYEIEIAEALKEDLGKSYTEAYMCEIGLVLAEIGYMIKHTRKFAKEKRVHTPLSQFASRSYKKPSPFGNVLVMSPWNYPFLLTMDPVVDAIAAGNTVLVKHSAYSPSTGNLVAKILRECYTEEYVGVVLGGRKENSALLDQKFDLVFFTGSQAVGKEVLRHTAEHLTPAVLELGGKSPCIVDKTAKIKLAAKRIVFGKFLNCGQTCVAPDYIWCDKQIKDQLVEEIKLQIKEQFSDDAIANQNYGKIINEKHFDRLCGLIEKSEVAYGGAVDKETMKIQPTVVDNATWDDAVMQEEIFGPILPVLTYEKIEDVYATLAQKQKPLALYVFSQDKNTIKETTTRCRYGGGCVNDVVIHLATSELAFGGVGESGMGSYHGKAGFDCFSHCKSIVDKKTWIDLPIRYQPYGRTKLKLVKKFLK